MGPDGSSASGSGLRWRAAAVLRLDAVTAEVVAALDAADVPSVLLKGPALSSWLYDAMEFRAYVDIDLIVPPVRRERAYQVLTDLGFRDRHAGTRAGESALHSDTWVRAGIEVDLHRSLLHVTAGPEAVWDVMSRDPAVIRVGGRPTKIPSEAARALVVAVKAIAGGLSDALSMNDLIRAIERLDVTVWEKASRLASELQAVELLAGGLRLVPEGAALADRLALPRRSSARVHVLGKVESKELRVAALRWARMAESGGPAGKLRFLARELLPSRASLTGGSADPLWRAYVRRLSSVLRTTPEGYAAWRAARREAEDRAPFLVRLEVFLWAQAARGLIRLLGLNRTLRIADSLPRRHRNSAPAPLEDFGVRRTTCLHRSVGRSQYMRRRGVPHDVVLGVARRGPSFRAHAWVEPPDPHADGFTVIHRLPR